MKSGAQKVSDWVRSSNLKYSNQEGSAIELQPFKRHIREPSTG